MIPPLHIITDDEILVREGFASQAAAVLRAGGKRVAFHIRGPRSEGRFLYDLASRLLAGARASGATLLVNDRVDVALALGLDGVHLGQRSLPGAMARDILGPEKLLGLSVHSEGEAQDAGEGLDYLMVGTLFDTPSHPGARPGGLRRIHQVSAGTGRPLVGIGGITPQRVPRVLEAGAAGVAVRGGVWDAPDPAAAVGVFLREVEEGLKRLQEDEKRRG